MPQRYVITGQPDLRFIQREGNFNQDTGYEFVDLYSGPKAAVEAGFNQVSSQGYTCSKRRDRGPCWKLTVQVGGNFIADRWERAVEWIQVDLRQCPELIAAAGNEKTLAEWIKDIDDSLPPNTVTEITTPATKAALWKYKARGGEAYETKRYILRLRRALPAEFIDQADAPDATERVYSTATLATTFLVPPVVASKLPNAPAAAAPSDTIWGWRLRTDDVEIIPFKNVATEIREWVFAAWSTLFYTAVT